VRFSAFRGLILRFAQDMALTTNVQQDLRGLQDLGGLLFYLPSYTRKRWPSGRLAPEVQRLIPSGHNGDASIKALNAGKQPTAPETFTA
jgi:hypothetical protein